MMTYHREGNNMLDIENLIIGAHERLLLWNLQ